MCFSVSLLQCFSVSVFHCFGVSVFQCFGVSVGKHDAHPEIPNHDKRGIPSRDSVSSIINQPEPHIWLQCLEILVRGIHKTNQYH